MSKHPHKEYTVPVVLLTYFSGEGGVPYDKGTLAYCAPAEAARIIERGAGRNLKKGETAESVALQA